MTAATLSTIFCAILLHLLTKGSRSIQCSMDDITVSQAETRQMVDWKPEYLVDVTNNCICTQSNLKLNCPGFNSVEKVDPLILSIDRNNYYCLFNNGQPFYGFTSSISLMHGRPTLPLPRRALKLHVPEKEVDYDL